MVVEGDGLREGRVTAEGWSAYVSIWTLTMDALKAELAAKRKAIEDDPIPGRQTKYMRRGDLDRLKEEQERKVREEKAAAEKEAQAEREAKALATKASKVCVLCCYFAQSILILGWRTGPFKISYQLASSRFINERNRTKSRIFLQQHF